MKLIQVNEIQHSELETLHPRQRAANYCALIPEAEYKYWKRCYRKLLMDLVTHYRIPATQLRLLTELPVMECVSKLMPPTEGSNGFLVPKAFKLGFIPEGNIKDLWDKTLLPSLLEVISSTLPYECQSFSVPNFKGQTNYLGFLAWNEDDFTVNHSDFYLPFYMQCTRDITQISIRGQTLYYRGKPYDGVLTTFNHYTDVEYQRWLWELNGLGLLALPLNFPPFKIKNLIGFSAEYWAQVHPLEYVLEENPEDLPNWPNYFLIRTDTGEYVHYDKVQESPKLRLELEMSDYWVWQEICQSPLTHLTLYWNYALEYPWIIDKRTKDWVPALVVKA